MKEKSQAKFIATIWDYYRKAGRHTLPWRMTHDPYCILVSEIMLQQTQVARVLVKYPEFLAKFPTVQALARASTANVIKTWQGLGYNRRALMLKRTAETVVHDFGGKFPGAHARDAATLESLPGIGQSTRGAIMAFAFNMPTAYIETNIRAVFIHFFFKNAHPAKKVHDRDILPLIEQTLDRKNPREWYYALMDYGVYLKQTLPNPSRKSAHHIKQSPFKGSNRELRSHILKLVLKGPISSAGIVAHFETNSKKRADIEKNITALEKEGFLKKQKNILTMK